MATDYSTRSTTARSWADLIVTILVHGGETIDDVDLAALSFEATRTRGVQKKRGRPYARTKGSSEYAASITFYDSGWTAFRPALVARAASLGVSIYDVPFDIVAKQKPIDSADVETSKLKSCLIDKASFDFSEGEDPQQNPIELNILGVSQIANGEEIPFG